MREESEMVLDLASRPRAEFERLVRSGKMGFLGEMLGYGYGVFTLRVKKWRVTKRRMAKASRARADEILEKLG